jgi:hypothetical protein
VSDLFTKTLRVNVAVAEISQPINDLGLKIDFKAYFDEDLRLGAT